jgi:hypothetical protein
LNHLPPPLLDGIRDRLREQPSLFGQLEDGQANELQSVHGGSEAAVALPASFMDYLCFALIFWLRPVGTFQFLFSDKSVSEMCRPGIRPALPMVQAQGAHPR